jgi:hypothetical protein
VPKADSGEDLFAHLSLRVETGQFRCLEKAHRSDRLGTQPAVLRDVVGRVFPQPDSHVGDVVGLVDRGGDVLKLKIGVSRLVMTSSRILTIISVARAVLMPPRSTTSSRPNDISSSAARQRITALCPG